MKFIYLFVGCMAALFLFPMFNNFWKEWVPSLITNFGITDPFILLWLKTFPYVMLVSFIVACFWILRGRTE